MKAVAVICVWLGGVFSLSPVLAGDALQNSIQLQAEVGREAVQSQKQVELLYDQKQHLLDEYRQADSELQSLQRYDEHLQNMVSAQEQKITSLEQQLLEIDVTHREVIPLMSRMTETLKQFIELDVPFLLTERRQRVLRLEGLIDRPDITVAEKYRQVIEAYQVETDYGRTLESYPGSLNQGGRQLTVDFLRVGRLVLLYRTLDGSAAGVWNQKTRSWQLLPEDYWGSLTLGYRMAKKQVAPDLLRLLVPAPEQLQ